MIVHKEIINDLISCSPLYCVIVVPRTKSFRNLADYTMDGIRDDVKIKEAINMASETQNPRKRGCVAVCCAKIKKAVFNELNEYADTKEVEIFWYSK